MSEFAAGNKSSFVAESCLRADIAAHLLQAALLLLDGLVRTAEPFADGRWT